MFRATIQCSKAYEREKQNLYACLLALLQTYDVSCLKHDKNQDKVSTLYWLTNLHKKPLKQDLLLILVLVRPKKFLNC